MYLDDAQNPRLVEALRNGDFRGAEQDLAGVEVQLAMQPGSRDIALINNVALLYMELGHLAKAKSYMESAWHEAGLEQDSVTDEYWQSVIRLNMARLLRYIGDDEHGLQTCIEAVPKISSKIILAQIFMLESAFYRVKGEYSLAETAILSARQLANSDGFPETEYSEILQRQGTLYRAMGRYREAEATFRDAIAHNCIHDLTWHPCHGNILSCLAELVRSAGREDESRTYYAQALRILRRAYGTWHPLVAMHIGNVAELHRDRHEYEKAEKYYRHCLSVIGLSVGVQHPEYVKRLANLGELYLQTGRAGEAIRILQDALDALVKLYGEEHHHVAKIQHNICCLLFVTGEVDKALHLCQKALQTRLLTVGIHHHHTARSYLLLSRIYRFLGVRKAALSARKLAITIYLETLGIDHAETKKACERLEVLFT